MTTVGSNFMRITLKRSLILIFLLIGLSGCATHYHDSTYGFISGFFHGLVLLPVLFLKAWGFFISIFGMEHYWLDVLKFTGKPNTGETYFLGYVIGIFFQLGAYNN
jgi:hypothetical protein